MLVCYSDISLTPNGHSTQRPKLRILIKARLQTAPKFLRIKSIFDRISTRNNPQPLCICLCYTSLRTGNRPNKRTSSEIRDGHTLFKTDERGRGMFRSTFLMNERVLEPHSCRAKHTSDSLTEAKRRGVVSRILNPTCTYPQMALPA